MMHSHAGAVCAHYSTFASPAMAILQQIPHQMLTGWANSPSLKYPGLARGQVYVSSG